MRKRTPLKEIQGVAGPARKARYVCPGRRSRMVDFP